MAVKLPPVTLAVAGSGRADLLGRDCSERGDGDDDCAKRKPRADGDGDRVNPSKKKS